MVEVILSAILIAISALAGILITYFARSELMELKNYIRLTKNILAFVVILVSFVLGFKNIFTIIGLAIGFVAYNLLKKSKNEFNIWIWLSIILGGSFVISKNVGITISLVMILNNIIFSSFNNISAALKKIENTKSKIIEQLTFIFSALLSFVLLILLGKTAASIAIYAATILFAGELAKKGL